MNLTEEQKAALRALKPCVDHKPRVRCLDKAALKAEIAKLYPPKKK